MISFTFPQRAGRARAGTGHGSAGPQTGGTARTVRRTACDKRVRKLRSTLRDLSLLGLGRVLGVAVSRAPERRAHLLLLR